MVIIPNSDIYLLKTPFEMSDNNQLTFSSKDTQYNYFNSLPKLELHNATYQRKDGILRCPTDPVNVTFEDLIQYNYCMYRNTAYNNKWFYAYIENITYQNDGMCEVSLKTDVFQSWQHDIDYKQSFIEREHVNDDTIGLNTIDEGVETGDYICNQVDDLPLGTANLICCLCSDFPPMLELYFKKSIYNGIYSGGKAVVFASAQDASYFVQYMEAQAKGDAIISFFMLPNSAIAGELTFQTKELDFDPSIFGESKKNVSFAPIEDSLEESFIGAFDVTRNTTLNGYSPKNNKLFTKKYNYLYITNNAGSDVEFYYEDFVNNTPSFEIWGAFAVGGSIRLFPKNYLKYSENEYGHFYNYGITGAKYPVCSWNSDSYTAWLAENSLNIALETGKNALQIIGGIGALGLGIATANPTLGLGGAGLLASGGLGVGEILKEKYNHSRMPDQARGNTNSGDVQFASDKNCFTAYKMSVRREYAKIIDDYFSMYGYQVNTLKIPNITGRRNWNYVKTSNCNITGNIPQKDLSEIMVLFNKGITLWHNPSTFLDYSQNNSII